jgi:hypothetical protein
MWCRKILGCLDHQLLGWLEDGEGLGHVARAHSRFGRESTCSVSGTANDANRVVADGVADHRPLCRMRIAAGHRPASQYRSMRRPRPRQVFALAVAGLLRSDGRVGQELPYLLRTAAGDGDLGSPLERLLA